jgi:hypothetical protein
METTPLGKKEQKSERVKVIDYTKGELKEQTERMDREIEEANRLARVEAERQAKEKELEKEQNREGDREMNLIKMRMNKPTMSGFLKLNLKSGKTQKVKQGEFNPMLIDLSDPSFEDGDIVKPERGDKRVK